MYYNEIITIDSIIKAISPGALDYAVDIGVFFGGSVEILSAEFFNQRSCHAKCIDLHRHGIPKYKGRSAKRNDRILFQFSYSLERLVDITHVLHRRCEKHI